MNLNDYATDAKAEVEGVWNELPDGAALLIAHISNGAYEVELQRLMMPHLALIRSRSKEGAALLRKIQAKAKAKTVLLGWRGVVLDGEEVPYSSQVAEKLLTDPKYRPFQQLVDSFASDDNAYRLNGEQGKASGSTSDTGSESAG